LKIVENCQEIFKLQPWLGKRAIDTVKQLSNKLKMRSGWNWYPTVAPEEFVKNRHGWPAMFRSFAWLHFELYL
jgi:hypothetical protein